MNSFIQGAVSGVYLSTKKKKKKKPEPIGRGVEGL
jgi:hypothetical protein